MQAAKNVNGSTLSHTNFTLLKNSRDSQYKSETSDFIFFQKEPQLINHASEKQIMKIKIPLMLILRSGRYFFN